MGSEQLSVPEENLQEVIDVIRAGLASLKGKKKDVSEDTKGNLTTWCDEMQEYLDEED